MKDLMKKVKNTLNTINVRYDMKTEDLYTIYNNSANKFDLFINFFGFGYMQGQKAALSTLKKKKI